MNPIVFALRHPITVLVAILGVICGGALAYNRTKIDIFPSLDLPVVYICQPYGGMDPDQMEGLLTSFYEFHFFYISGIHHVESRNIQGMALLKLYFHPGTDMAQSMAETVAAVNRARFMMPPGTVPPFVTRFDTGSAAIGYIVLSSETRPIKELQDLATLTVRPLCAGLPGVSTPPSFGGNQRTILINVDPDRLRSYHLSADDVVAAVSAGNAVSPSGNARVRDRMPVVRTNAMVDHPVEELKKVPLGAGQKVHLRNVATIEDSSDTLTGYSLVDGRRSVYILLTKRSDASTLEVVDNLKAGLPRIQDAVPEDVRVRFVFDQSPVVSAAMRGVAVEGALGAVLTGLMVLLFLRDWRTVLVVVLNIPLALTAALIGLWLCGQTINLMTLGGLALAVGILVDEATVEIENIHKQMETTGSVARAVRRGNSETAVPRLLAMLCIVAVFIPSFFMEGAARSLFVPLSLAVGFAMISSYLLSSTFVPVLSVWLLKRSRKAEGARTKEEKTGKAKGIRASVLPTPSALYEGIVRRVVRHRRWAVGGYLLVGAAVIGIGGSQLGMEIFPPSDSGQLQLRLRAATGTRIERTEEIAQQALAVIKEEVGPENVTATLGYVGTFPTNYPIQAIYQWTSGPEEAILRVKLRPEAGIAVGELRQRLRQTLPGRLRAWMRPKLRAEGLAEEEVASRLAGLRLSFEPADIVNEVMSFGSPTPVEIAVSGSRQAENRAHLEKIRAELVRSVLGLCDLQYVQPQDYPVITVAVDREKAGLNGVTARDVARSLVATTFSSRYIEPNFWRDPNTGHGYIVQVQVPPLRVDSLEEVGRMPVRAATGPATHEGAGPETSPFLVRDVARLSEGVMPGEVARYNMRRMVSLSANIEGEDLGRVERSVRRAIAAVGPPPRGVTVEVRGQVVPMRQMFRGLGVGLGLAVLVILLLLAAYYQSFRLAVAVMATVPAVVAGVILALLATRTTLNLQSFMGAIMAIGVAVANAILLVTFAERARRGGTDAAEAGRAGAATRVRPVLMTSCAMLAGMVPMAVGFGEGGDQAAPLGRAVIGGLLAATLTTLLVLPAVFAWLQGGAGRASASLDPDDPTSSHYDEQPAPWPAPAPAE